MGKEREAMNKLKKINRGLILTAAVVLAVAVYLGLLTGKANRMKTDAERLLKNFLAADAAWKVIPEEYMENYEGYIELLEPEMRDYFADDSAYQYYIENNIYSQYRTNVFYRTCDVSLIELFSSEFDNNILSLPCMISISGKTNLEAQGQDYGAPLYYSFSFKEVDGELKIYYLNYRSENFSGYDLTAGSVY